MVSCFDVGFVGRSVNFKGLGRHQLVSGDVGLALVRIIYYIYYEIVHEVQKTFKKYHMVDKVQVKNITSLSKHGKFTCSHPFLTIINSSSIRVLYQ